MLKVDLTGVSIGPYTMKINYSSKALGSDCSLSEVVKELLDIPVNIVKDACSKFCCFFF